MNTTPISFNGIYWLRRFDVEGKDGTMQNHVNNFLAKNKTGITGRYRAKPVIGQRGSIIHTTTSFDINGDKNGKNLGDKLKEIGLIEYKDFDRYV